MFKTMGLLHRNETKAVEEFIRLYSKDDKNFTKKDMLRFLSGVSLEKGPQPPKPEAKSNPIYQLGVDVKVEGDSEPGDQL